jgi:transcriptional regulator with GAF, ATPase, and Fis domain
MEGLDHHSQGQSARGPEVYLVLREGAAWREIYRLLPGSLMTIGREPTNRLVVADERCSRHHCAVFHERSVWRIRDLDSRNGTIVNGVRIDRDVELAEGATIGIGASELLFTSDLSRPLDSATPPTAGVTRETLQLELTGDSDRSDSVILGRISEPGFVTESSLASHRRSGPGVREAFATLYRLIVGMLSSVSTKQLCETVLEGLLPAVGADIGAVLLSHDRTADCGDPASLWVAAYRAPEQSPYRRVSTWLSTTALKEGEAILARGITSGSPPSGSGSLHEIEATSVICAPIRGRGAMHGLLHIYSRSSDRELGPDALELVLAVADQLATILESLDQKESLVAKLRQAQDQNRSLRQLLEIESDLVGDSLPMRELRDAIARIAPSGATILIRGESGVGKELVARAIHFNSPRRKGPFVCVNCAALTETLLESELFGHEKGAFTGATDRKAGKFEQADGGTLFLDEVGEMPMSIQAKFLRVLEEQRFERVGGTTSIAVDVRIVAATNRNLETALGEGQFRPDLLYRLQVIDLVVPPLRDHLDDLPALAELLLDRSCRRLGRPPMWFTSRALQALAAHDWPGNVRELRNVVERAVVLNHDPEIDDVDSLLRPLARPDTPPAETPRKGLRPASLEDVERLHILQTLESTRWKKREAARILGIDRSTLDRKLQKYELAAPNDPV